MIATFKTRRGDEFPNQWLRLAVPQEPGQIPLLARRADASGLALDVSAALALWGNLIRRPDAQLVCNRARQYAHATGASHA